MSYNYSFENSFDQTMSSSQSAAARNGNLSRNGYYEDVDELNAIVSRQQMQSQKAIHATSVSTSRTTTTTQQVPIVEYDEAPEYQYYSPQGYINDVDYVAGHSSNINTSSNNRIGSYDGYNNDYAVPSAPGAPQIVDLDSDMVLLVWLRPDTLGETFTGYQVQFRQVGELPWQTANDELVTEPQFPVYNLQTCGQYEFRVLAKNACGFSDPSSVSHPIQLRPKYGHVPFTHCSDQSVPFAPGRPRVVESDGTNATLCWEPPIASGSGGPVAGYHVEYKVISSNDWISATNYLVREVKYTVVGLRPNGDYEFRVFAKNADGLSPPSQSSGPIRIRPLVPTRSPNYVNASFVGSYYDGDPQPPSQPQITDVDSDMVTLIWAPPPPSSTSESPTTINYIVEYREIGDPNWYAATDRTILGNQFTIGNLRPNSTFEFRVFARNQFGTSEPSEVSEICQLRPKIIGGKSSMRNVPSRPTPPEIMEVYGDCVTICWAPAHSSLPLQGYQVEFRDSTQGTNEWLPVNPILMQSCKMTIGDLLLQREYEFRVTAKNAIGYSPPSEPSMPIFIGGVTNGSDLPMGGAVRDSGSSFNSDHLNVEINTAKESPPITDNDDSPPPLRRNRPPPGSSDNVEYRDPTLEEVLDYLISSNNVLKLNASGYLQHLTYHDDIKKNKVRELNGIPRVIELLRSDVPEIQKNACGCLKNLSYGNDENKKAIFNAGGVPALSLLLRKTPDMHVIEEMSGLLWNLSSHDDLKGPIMQQALEPLVKQIVLPYSGWSSTGRFSDSKIHPPAVFRNSTGILRNVSSANDSARKLLREREGLPDALVFYLHSACERTEIDTKAVENVVCVLRNLSYRLQEVEDPNYDKSPVVHERSKSAPSGSPKSKKKVSGNKNKKDDATTTNPLFKNLNKGVPLLWHPDTVRDYLKLLDQSSNPDTLEASAGAIQNLAACYWQPSVEIRATVRKEKGLPILVALLSIDNDKVVCASATALRNLALDQRNRELIGKYAMEDLVKKLPPTNVIQKHSNVSDDTLSAILSVIYITTFKSADFTRTLLEKGGVDRLVSLSNSKQHSARVAKYAAQVLFSIYQHKELHDLYKKAGFKEDSFVSRTVPINRNHADTLGRPVSTQGVERGPNSRVRPDWEDDYSARSRAPSTLNVGGNEIHENGTPPTMHNRVPANHPQNGHASSSMEPLYAQVQKKNRQLSVPVQSRVHTVNGSRSPTQFAGDSWV